MNDSNQNGDGLAHPDMSDVLSYVIDMLDQLGHLAERCGATDLASDLMTVAAEARARYRDALH